MSKDGIFIIGASGHGKVVASTLRAAGHKIAAFLDDDPALHGQQWFGYSVLGSSSLLKGMRGAKAVIAVGNSGLRQKLHDGLAGVEWTCAIHPGAWVDESVELGAGSVVFAGAVIQPDVKMGKHCIVNTGATVDHDCRLGDYTHVCPGVNLAGNVIVGDGVWLGIGCRTIQGVTIGNGAIVGAGATVIGDVPDKVVVVGTPAHIIRAV
jgi:sugar O-acyltransferase (sialic acid O-acetyltransferase NeuD family)